MLVGPPAKRPVVLAVRLGDRQVVDAGNAMLHEPVVIELPVLVAVGTEPHAGIVVELVGEANRDPVPLHGPELLDEPIVELAGPLAAEERDDFFSSLKELDAISPA